MYFVMVKKQNVPVYVQYSNFFLLASVAYTLAVRGNAFHLQGHNFKISYPSTPFIQTSQRLKKIVHLACS